MVTQGPLQKAIIACDISMVKDLLDQGVDANANPTADLEFAPIIVAAEYSTAEIVELLIDKGAELEARNNHGNTPLMVAVLHSRPEIVQLLIDKGAKVEARNNHGNTPLISAVSYSKPEIVKLLLDAGADLEARNKDDETPILKVIGSTTNCEIVKLLIDKGADLEARGNGRTPLMQAAFLTDYPKLVQLLLDGGADPLAKDRSGKKAVDFAHRYKWYGEVYPILHQVTYPIRHKIFGTRVNWTKWRENALYLLGFSLTLTVFVLLLMGFSHLGDSLGLPFKIEHEPVLIYEPDGIGGYDQYWSEETKTDWFFISIVVAVLVTGRFTQILLFDGKKFQWSEETEVAWWCWFWCFFTLALVEIAWLKLPRFPFDGLASLASLAICGFGFFKLYRYLLTKKE